MVGDRISTLPETLLCHILSFLPTKAAVATSVLSKRWNPLWRSVSALDFDDDNCRHDNSKESFSRFVQSVYAFIVSRDMDRPIQRFSLRCLSCHCDPNNVNIWVNAALQRRVEHLNISLPRFSHFNLPFAVHSCKTVVVLKLTRLSVKPFPFFDFPSLKILHLIDVDFLEHSHLADLLSGMPNLEEFEAPDLYFLKYDIEGKFRRLPKMVRANISRREVPLDVVSNVEFLCADWGVVNPIDDFYPNFKYPIPDFHNLTHLEVEFATLTYTEDWLEVLELLKHCPKLQILVLNKDMVGMSDEADEEPDWSYPPSIPICISLHLKTCRLNNYEGSKGEFRLATYILQNALHLQTMTICSLDDDNQGEKLEMIKKLSLCTRCSTSCRLSFE